MRSARVGAHLALFLSFSLSLSFSFSVAAQRKLARIARTTRRLARPAGPVVNAYPAVARWRRRVNGPRNNTRRTHRTIVYRRPFFPHRVLPLLSRSDQELVRSSFVIFVARRTGERREGEPAVPRKGRPLQHFYGACPPSPRRAAKAPLSPRRVETRVGGCRIHPGSFR